MWIVNEEFLQGVATGAEPFVSTVIVPRDQPYFDIEMISDVHLSTPDPAEFIERFRSLRFSFNEGRPSHLLASCGDITADYSGDPQWDDEWIAAFETLRPLVPDLLVIPGNRDISAKMNGPSLHERLTARIVRNRDVPQRLGDLPFATVSRVCMEDVPEPSRALAYVVVIGFDSNEAEYKNRYIEDHGQISEMQFDLSGRLVRMLATTIALNTPLYVIGMTHHDLLPTRDRDLTTFTGPDGLAARAGVLECRAGSTSAEISELCAINHMISHNCAGGTTNGTGFLAHCRKARISIVVHANMHRPDIQTLSSTSLEPGASPSQISVVACPPFARASRLPGMARLRINVWKGEAEIAFSYERGPDGGNRPIQIVRPLLSASRVTSSERRLYETVRQLLARAARSDTGSAAVELASFSAHVEQYWVETGYVALCYPDGSLPDLPATRKTRYNLLLLLRERASGGFDILLSRHNPLRLSQFGDWDTLLLPAFSDARYLLEHLRDDVVRQVVDQAEDLQMAAQVRALEDAIDRILGKDGSPGGDIWTDQMREVATTTKRKISPTTGCVTDYEYHLVTLLPLVHRPALSPETEQPQSGENSPNRLQTQRWHDYNTILEWFNELPWIHRQAADRARGGRSVPIEALQSGGGGLRWDPVWDLGDEPYSARSAGVQKVAPGAIWFPLPDDDDDPLDAPWGQCLSIVARNADVMQWVHRELATRRRLNGGSFPSGIVMGQVSARSNTIEFVGPQFPFSSPVGDRAMTPGVPSCSTTDAISKVKYMRGFDLDGEYAYRDLEVKRVLLVRRDIPVWSGTRPVILAFDADIHDPNSARHALPREATGVLRPVQRYVLRAGLERAGELREEVLLKLDDPWGFARIRKGDAPEPVTVTPPILEQLHPEDWEDEHGADELIVCDGNHRVVELVWNRGHVLPAVAVIGTPKEPYYARPFSRFEWGYTAENVQNKSPDQASKYAVRKVNPGKLGLAAAAILARQDPQYHYRRYFRDLTTGFGYMGGQGGNYV